MRLTELVETLCLRGVELEEPNPVVVVALYVGGERVERTVEFVQVDGGGRVELYCPDWPNDA